MSWATRLHRPPVTLPLRQVQAATEDLADQAGLTSGKTRIVFRTVADCAVITTVCLSGLLAAVHLYKALFPWHKEDHPQPQPAGGNRSPPRRPGPRVATVAGDDEGFGKDASRFR